MEKKRRKLSSLLFVFLLAGLVMVMVPIGCSGGSSSDDDDDTTATLADDDDDDTSADDDDDAVADDDDDTTTGGVWEDSDSGLMWQNTQNETVIWQDAIDYCEALALDGETDWRLPSINELRSLIRGCTETETDGACGVTDSCVDSSTCWDSICLSCSEGGGPDIGCYWDAAVEGDCSWYWSSSSRSDYEDTAWFVDFNDGDVSSDPNDYFGGVRCVRQ
jgi:Protein of unknown function (DUF1566)